MAPRGGQPHRSSQPPPQRRKSVSSLKAGNKERSQAIQPVPEKAPDAISLSFKPVGPVHRVPAFSLVLLPENRPARMGFTICGNDGFPGVDGEIQSNSPVAEEIPLSPAYILDTLFSIDSDAGRRASDG